MAIKTYNDTNVQAIADAIRAKNFQTTTYKVSQMAAAIRALETGLDLLPQDTAAGVIANFPDGSNGYPVVSLEAAISGYQLGDGDAAPDNIRQFVSFSSCKVKRTGVNVFDGELETGSISSTSGENITGANRVRTPGYIPCIGGRSYYLNKDFTETVAFRFYNANKVFLGSSSNQSITESGVVTFPQNAAYFRFGIIDATLSTFTGKLSINSDSTDTIYHAYAGETKDISFGRNVYIGSLNVTTGVLTITDGLITYTGASSEDWRLNGSNGVFIRFPDGIITGVNKYKLISPGSGSGLGSMQARMNGDQISLLVKDTDHLSVNSFISSLAAENLVVSYTLHTPETIQLTPEQVLTVLGENNIFADTGDVDVTYRADIDLYIAKKIAEGANA